MIPPLSSLALRAPAVALRRNPNPPFPSRWCSHRHRHRHRLLYSTKSNNDSNDNVYTIALPSPAPENYLLFSDLHLSPSTLPQCLNLLRSLISAASSRPRTSVLFLGDFWHTRGSINVQCLNAVYPLVQELSSACQGPLLMLPGNHDLVDFQGRDSSIDIFGALENVEVVKETSIFGSAGLVPYKRRGIASDIKNLASRPSCSTLFIHDEVKGGVMSGRYRSRRGLKPEDWEGFKGEIWSGHFHKVQKVGAVNYVGSGYQTSASEAGEYKRFVWLDADFRYDSDVPLPRLGREYHVGLEGLERAVSGDVVTLTFTSGEAGLAEKLQKIKEAGGAKGVEVRVKMAKPEGAETSDDGRDKFASTSPPAPRSPSSLLSSYLKKSGAPSASHQVDALATELLSNATETTLSYRPPLILEELTVDGFASFAGATRYPLSDRGLVLVKGRGGSAISADDYGPSNGSGKSTLLMSALWCLLGVLDERPANAESVNDVVNINCKETKVRQQQKKMKHR